MGVRVTQPLKILLLLLIGIPSYSIADDFLDGLTTIADWCTPQSGRCPKRASQLSSEAQEWVRNGFGDPQISTLPLRQLRGRFTHELDLSLVMFRKANWTPRDVQEKVQQAAEIYATCGIRITNPKLIVVNAPSGQVDIKMAHGPQNEDLAARTPSKTSKPILYFVRYEFGKQWAAWSAPRSWAGESGRSSESDMAWITSWILDERYQETQARYGPEAVAHSNVAHELTHLLVNTPQHWVGGDKNVFEEKVERLNNTMLPKVCELAKANPLLRRL